MTEQLHRDAERPAGRVPADQAHLVRTRQIAEPTGELLEPGLIRLGQGEGEQRPGGSGAHRCKIAQVDRERTVADRGGR